MKNFNNGQFASLPARISRASLVFLLAGAFVLAAPVAGGAQAWNPQRVAEPLLRPGREESPIGINYDKMIWSGLSWALGEIRHDAMHPREPITIRCSSTEENSVALDCKFFAVQY
jgi:hypothetical protein